MIAAEDVQPGLGEADDRVNRPADLGSASASAEASGGDRGLGSLLELVAVQGWDGVAGRRAVGVMQRACRLEARNWTRTAGWLTDEGLAAVWEQMNRLVVTGRFADAPGLLRVVVRRVYAGEAAAAQTGVGSPTTRGLIGAIKRSEASAVGEYGDQDIVATADENETGHLVAPPWMRTLAAVLAVEGWRWPVPPLHAVMASARVSRSPVGGAVR